MRPEVREAGDEVWAGVDLFYAFDGLWETDRFAIYEVRFDSPIGPMTRLTILHREGENTQPTFYEKQEIKTAICGPERVAVEVFPAEGALVDDTDAWHLWVLPEGHTLPFELKRKGGW